MIYLHKIEFLIAFSPILIAVFNPQISSKLSVFLTLLLIYCYSLINADIGGGTLFVNLLLFPLYWFLIYKLIDITRKLLEKQDFFKKYIKNKYLILLSICFFVYLITFSQTLQFQNEKKTLIKSFMVSKVEFKEKILKKNIELLDEKEKVKKTPKEFMNKIQQNIWKIPCADGVEVKKIEFLNITNTQAELHVELQAKDKVFSELAFGKNYYETVKTEIELKN